MLRLSKLRTWQTEAIPQFADFTCNLISASKLYQTSLPVPAFTNSETYFNVAPERFSIKMQRDYMEYIYRKCWEKPTKAFFYLFLSLE